MDGLVVTNNLLKESGSDYKSELDNSLTAGESFVLLDDLAHTQPWLVVVLECQQIRDQIM